MRFLTNKAAVNAALAACIIVLAILACLIIGLPYSDMGTLVLAIGFITVSFIADTLLKIRWPLPRAKCSSQPD